MPGTPLGSFQDFVFLSPSVFFSSPDKFVNEAVDQNYETLARALVGRDGADLVSGGYQLKDQIIDSDVSSYRTYNPNAEHTYSNPQVTSQWTAPWRFSAGDMAWVDQEVMLNQPAGAGTDGQFSLWKRVKTAKETAMWNGIFGGMEADFWRSPHNEQDNMESEDSNTPLRYSIPALLNEDTTNGHAGGWTTVQGLDPATKEKWRNQVVRYNHQDPEDADGDRNGLFDALADARLRLNFRPPPMRKNLYEDPSSARRVIFTSRHGFNLLEKLSRESNDRFALKQDAAYMHPTSGGVEVVHCGQLDDAQLYYNGSTYVDEMDSTLLDDGTAWSTSDWTMGPRYYFLDFHYLRPFFHPERKFHKHKPRNPDRQFESWYMPISIWWQIVARSRRRLLIVGPGCPAGTASSSTGVWGSV
jgi:hypothetical protein